MPGWLGSETALFLKGLKVSTDTIRLIAHQHGAGARGVHRNLRCRPAEAVALCDLHRQVLELETRIKAWHRDHPASLKLAEIPGIGPITASAMVASGA